ncbi:hypothetical protein [uncultured Porphyromonas sp.]|uniref:hypothetical protein n=1 Tax=uncultured Porphyromonas sp. TaxID=159274 RepID=UPI00260FA9B7|nr:hypothetical protein [uncultured Porphyromonas sp.]
MKENPIMDKVQRDLIRKYHAVAASAGLSESERHAILSSYGVESSRDLTQHQLIDVIATISSNLNAHQDRLRKRLIASIGRYLRTAGYDENIVTIKATAVRASGYDSFNKIPPERMRSLIFAFNHKTRDLESVNEITQELQQKHKKKDYSADKAIQQMLKGFRK